MIEPTGRRDAARRTEPGAPSRTQAKESAITTRPLSNPRWNATWPRLNWSDLFWWSAIHAGTVLAPFTFTWSGLGLCLALYLAAGFGVTMGYHRLLTHRSFQTPKLVEYFLTFLGTLANQGGPLRWVAVHRIHHQHSDRPGDPHSPCDGVWWAHLLWWMPYDPALDEPRHYGRYVADLVKDPVLRFLQRFHFLGSLVLAALLFLFGEFWAGVGLSWLVWGMFVRTTLLYHATWLVNSATHSWGYRSYATRDTSTNLWWVALLTLGEGWHNNHHAFPRSARHGLRWWEVDLTYGLIRLLSLVKLARQIHVPGKALCRPTAGSCPVVEHAARPAAAWPVPEWDPQAAGLGSEANDYQVGVASERQTGLESPDPFQEGCAS